MENFKTQSTSANSAKLTERIIIEEHSITRKVLFVELNDIKRGIGETVSITIIHQRKNLKQEWEDIDSINLNTLKGGEGVKLRLDSKTTKIIYDKLSEFYALVEEQGIQFGIKEFTVAKADEIITVDKNRKTIIEQLINKNYGQELWEELISNSPDLATKLALARINIDRKQALETFKKNLESKNSEESFWQKFFTENDWIFGYGLNYQFLHLLQEQPDYGGRNYTGTGSQKGDFMLNTSANYKFTVLVEIKTPVTSLLSYKNGNLKQIRNDVWLLSGELLGAISQIQVNCRTWVIGSQNPENVRKLEKNNIYTVEPKGILVIGNTNEFENENKESIISCFESFRRNLKNPEIITFDELYNRAEFIVNNKFQIEEIPNEVEEDNFPF